LANILASEFSTSSDVQKGKDIHMVLNNNSFWIFSCRRRLGRVVIFI